MSWLEFASNIIDNVFSWPVAVLLIVLFLRKQIREVLLSVENFVVEGGGTKVSVTRSLELAKESITAAKAILPHPEESGAVERQHTKDLAEQYSYVSELAQRNPPYAMEVAWERLITEQVRRLARKWGLSTVGDTTYLLTELNSLGVVPDTIVETAKSLNPLVLEVRAGPRKEASPNEALEYTRIAFEFGRYLNHLEISDAISVEDNVDVKLETRRPADEDTDAPDEQK